MPTMCRTRRPARLTSLTIAAAIALSLAGCGTSNKPAPSASPASSPARGRQQVAGLVAAVSGSTIQIRQQSGSATVDLTPSTTVTEITPAQLTDVTAGSCVKVRPTRESTHDSTAITAQSVQVSPAADGQCRQPKQPPARSATTPSAPSSRAPARHPAVQGTVASVSGNTITVTGPDASQTTVTVTDATTYTKQITATAQAIAQGTCIVARGTAGAGGALQATTVTVRQATDGGCPQPGEQHHGHGG